MTKEQIGRINELARRKKTEGLTPAETQEHEALRRQYLEEFRQNMRATLDRVYVQQKDGSYEKLRKKSEKK